MPFSLIIIAATLFLGLWFGCNKKPGSGPTPPPYPHDSIVINKDIDVDYLTGVSPTINFSSSETITLAHKLLNLKKLSDDNKNTTDFVVEGTVDFGFLVDPDMNCFLYGMDNSLVNLQNITGNACGIIVGNDGTPIDGIYKGNMLIDKSLTFNIRSSSNAYGVYFNNTAVDSAQTINGTFTIYANSIPYGVNFQQNTCGFTTINGTFIIISNSYYGYGVYFKKTAVDSVQTINGTFTITAGSFSNIVNQNPMESIPKIIAVYFDSTASSTTIDGTFNISSTFTAYGIYVIYAYSTATIMVDGVFTIATKGASYGVWVYTINENTAITVDGTFTIYSTNGLVYGILFNGFATNAFEMKKERKIVKFFSNKVDSGNIFQTLPAWANKTYKWNNADVVATGSPIDGNNSTNDPDLKLTDVVDKTSSPNFTIKVIDECGESNQLKDNKKIFNTAYKNALDSYVKSSDCPTTAKKWLKEIIHNIPISN